MIINDISKDLAKSLPEIEDSDCIVIISRYNTGKTTSAVDIITKHLGNKYINYITLTNQDKPNVKARNSDIAYNEIPSNKVIIFDELTDDMGRDLTSFLSKLLRQNKVIILTNPYGQSNDAEKEIALFREHETVPENTLFVYVTNN